MWRRRILFVLELTIVSTLVLVTRCANYRDVFADGQIYFVDADCYARMTRARMCLEHPGIIIRRHGFENFPTGTSPHTTAPLDYLIVAVATLLNPFARDALDLAGAIISPLIGVGLGIFLCWWTRQMKTGFRFALLGLYAVSPILTHGTALGRPDHQSLLIALIAVALCAEWMIAREPSWSLVCGASWGLAIWVSLYEPLVLLVLLVVMRAPPLFRRFGEERGNCWPKWIAFAAVVAIAIVIERRVPSWPDAASFSALEGWSSSIGELTRVPLYNSVWFEWCGWLLLLTPILFWWRLVPSFLIGLLIATFLLTLTQARWSYYFALMFILIAPGLLGFFRKPIVAALVFVISLFPIAQAWDRDFSEEPLSGRMEKDNEQRELRALAAEITGPLLAPWWFSPALSYWSRQPALAGSSHESISGIMDCARFYAATDPAEAAAICAQREVKWVVSYDGERMAENSSRILHRGIGAGAICYVLDRYPSQAPSFLHLVGETARFKLYRVEK